MKRPNLKTIKNKVRGFNRLLLKKMIVGHLQFLKHLHGLSPVSLEYWLAIRDGLYYFGVREPDLLLPPYGSLRSTGTLLNIPELECLLANETLGEWALDTETIALLWDSLWRDKPRLLLECGAGVSTLVLAVYASLASGKQGGGCLVISLEQDPGLKEQLEERLRESSLGDWVQLIYAPLDDRAMYNTDSLSEVLPPQSKVDWILVDGPSGPPGCRFGTLPTLLKFCRSGATWFLDDAFRDAELRILEQWENLPGIAVEGIYPIGKGLARGDVL